MNHVLFIFLSISSYIFAEVDISPSNVKINYEELYKSGVHAYLENRWRDSVSLIERSIEDFIYFNTIVVRCRKKCQRNDFNILPNDTDSSSSLWRLQTVITERALCLMKCQKSYFPNRPKASKDTDEAFERKDPYNYLQLCYFKVCLIKGIIMRYSMMACFFKML